MVGLGATIINYSSDAAVLRASYAAASTRSAAPGSLARNPRSPQLALRLSGRSAEWGRARMSSSTLVRPWRSFSAASSAIDRVVAPGAGPDLLDGGAPVDQDDIRVVRRPQLGQHDPTPVAGVVAGPASRGRGTTTPGRRVVRRCSARSSGDRGVGLPAVHAHLAHQALGNHAQQRRGDQVGVYPEVAQPGSARWRRSCAGC